MKKLFTNNILLKVLALIAAVILWYMVVNVNDPLRTANYTVNVTLKNTSTVTDANLVYEILDDTDVVTVTVKAPRSVLSAMEASDLTVVADFDNITQMNMVPLEVSSAKYGSKIEQYTLSHTNLKVSLEDADSRDYTISVETEGTPADGYTVGSASSLPNYVTVNGPVSLLEQISEIKAVISVDEHSSTMRSNVTLVAVDSGGEELSDSRLTFSQSEVLVTVDFLQTKTVSLKVSTTGKCADGYYLADVQSDPTTILIAGEEEVLAEISSIEIPAEVLDISDAVETVEATVDIQEYLPENVQLLADEDSSVTLTALIEEQEQKTIYVPVSSINLMNTPENMRASFGDLSEITVIVSGDTEVLDALTASDLTVSVDLTGLDVGTHRLDVSVVTPDDISLMSTTWIDVTLESTVTETEETITE